MANKTVIVTGASGGIGRAISIKLSALGFDLILHYNSNSIAAAETAKLITSAGGIANLVKFDLKNREAVHQSINTILSDYGAPWGIVSNAGIHRDGPFPGLSNSDWDDVLDTNLDGFFNLVQPLVMPMIQRRDGGRIVTISSLSGIIGNRGQVNYSAAKAGLIGATKALSKELAKRKIAVNCVAPGFIDTGMTEELATAEMLEMIPMKRAGKPEEVAALVGFLFSNEAEYITGQIISINGGIA